MASQPDPVTHELRGDLRYDDELFDTMVEEAAQWEARLNSLKASGEPGWSFGIDEAKRDELLGREPGTLS